MSVTAERVTVPWADAREKQATLAFGHGVDRLTISASSGLGHLLEADLGVPGPVLRSDGGRIDVDYPHLGILRRAHPSSILLDARTVWEILVEGGLHDVHVELTGVDLRRFDVQGGASELELVLDAPDGPRTISADWLDGVRIRRPRGVDVRVEVRDGARRLAVDDQRMGHANGIAVQSPFYDPAGPGYLITVEQANATSVMGY